jgi:hypothetical protein
MALPILFAPKAWQTSTTPKPRPSFKRLATPIWAINTKPPKFFFEIRRYNTEARRAEKSAPLSTEQYMRLARVEAPPALTSTQLDPLTGAIGWPLPLAVPEYAMFRVQIEQLFADRYSGNSSFAAIQQACQAFLDQIQVDVAKFQANDYIASRKYLDSLIFAAKGIHP